MEYSLKQLMDEREGYYFTINFNPKTQEIRTQASIPFGLMATAIGATLSNLNISEQEFNSFMFGLVNEFEKKERNKKNEQDEDDN